MITKTFHYNKIDGISRRYPPYEERLYLKILEDYMKRNNIESEELLTKA
jgi:hypothetical protein